MKLHLNTIFLYSDGSLRLDQFAHRGYIQNSVEIFKIQLDTVLGNWLKMTLLEQRIWSG